MKEDKNETGKKNNCAGKNNNCSCKENSCACEENENKNEEITLSKIILSAVLFIVAVVMNNIPVLQKDSALIVNNKMLAEGVPIVEMALYLAAFLICGLPVLKEAVWNLFHGHVFDEEFLMSVASVGAICLGQYPEAVAVMVLFQLGEYLEDKAVDKSKRSVTELMNIRPDKAFLLQNGKAVEVKPEDVRIGETIVVKAGERVPLDGVITKGSTFADTSALTGESVPRELLEGCEILAGFVNKSGTVEVKVLKPYGESSAARVIELVENAASKKAKSEKFITKFSKIYTPAVCIAAVLVAVIPPLVSMMMNKNGSAQIVNATPLNGLYSNDITGCNIWQTWIYRALLFLVISCPCALVISVPLSFFAGIGASSRRGILIKGAGYIEKLAKINTAVFDKTGTLTKGVFVVTAIHPVDKEKVSAEELLAIATHAEYYSNHLISKSLKVAHHGECCEKVVVGNTEEISGQGLKTVLDGKKILAGNMKLMVAEKVLNVVPCKEDDTGTIVHVAIDGEYAGHIVISDEVKENAEEAIKSLKKNGVKKTVMLTGDSESAAKKTSKNLGIDKVFYNLLPGDKVSELEKLIDEEKQNGGTLAFVGDGINDAPVLTRADVGIAMGAMGSDAAIEAADVIIMNDDPMKISESVVMAKKTMRIVNENIYFSLGIKFAIMVLGVLGIANMWMAVFGDVGVTMIAVLNSMRLLAGRKEKHN